MKNNFKQLCVIIIMIVALSGCNNNGKSSTASSHENENENAQTEITFYFTRHGKTMLNTTDRSQGWADAPLTPEGEEVAGNLGKGLKESEITFDAVFSSDSGRSVQTAEIILNNNGQTDLLDDISTDERLRESNFGTYEGMENKAMYKAVADSLNISLEELMSKMKTDGFYKYISFFIDNLSLLDEKNVEDGVNWPAENSEDFKKRLVSIMEDIKNASIENKDRNVLIAAHGGSIAFLLVQLDASCEAKIPYGLENASICKVVYNIKEDTYKVETINDISYVEQVQ